VRHLERFPPGTPSAEVGEPVKAVFTAALAGGTLVVDQTAVGRPVVELLQRADVRAQLCRVTVTAGHRAARDPGGVWLVPKTELVSCLQILLQGRRLKVSPALPESATLVQELTTFQADPPTKADEGALSWREQPHDDLVLAIAVAAWMGERLRPVWVSAPTVYDAGLPWERGWRRR
jgi:hypothetical protein